jgi:hypothetical protein
MIVSHVVMLLMVIAATPSHFFELVAAFFRLFAVFAMLRHRIAQLVFRPVNISVTFVFRPHWHGRANQSDNRQQCNTKNLDHASHFFCSPEKLI